MAYYVLAQDEYKQANDKAQGMGRAVTFFKVTSHMFEQAKNIVVNLPSNYQENFNTKYQEVIKLRDKALNENKTIYFEREMPID